MWHPEPFVKHPIPADASTHRRGGGPVALVQPAPRRPARPARSAPGSRPWCRGGPPTTGWSRRRSSRGTSASRADSPARWWSRRPASGTFRADRCSGSGTTGSSPAWPSWCAPSVGRAADAPGSSSRSSTSSGSAAGPSPERYFREYLVLTDRHRALLPGTRRRHPRRAGAIAGGGVARLPERARAREPAVRRARAGHRHRAAAHPGAAAGPAGTCSPEAAARAEQAGFDGVELHYAHAYTMASFLSALNQRDDGYGGSRANRVRLPLEVYRAVRGAVGERFVVGCRFLAEECIPGGSTRRGRGLVRRGARAGRDGLPLALARGQVRGRQAAAGGLGPLSLHRAQRLRVHADRAVGRARTVRPEPRRHPRGAGGGARRGVPDAGRAVGRDLDLRAGGGAAPSRRGGHRRLRAAEPGRPRLVPEAPARPGRRSAALRLHQLLRGPRPGAQAGDLQALGPRRPRRATRRRAPPTAAAGWWPRRGSRPPGERRDRRRGARRPLSRHPAQARRPEPSGDGLRAEPARGHVRLRRGVLRRDPGERRRGRSRDQPGDGRGRGALGGHRDPLPRHRHAVDRASLLRRRAEDPAGAARPAGAIARRRDPVAAGDPGPRPTAAFPPPT